MSAGAYSADLTGYPDEPCHAVTGVAAAEYVTHALSQSPVAYFAGYYRHLPKVAIGHWPPMLYVAEAAAILAGGPSAATLLALQALLAGILAWLVFRELRDQVGGIAAMLGAGAFLFNREFRYLSSMAMAEVLLHLTMFLACLYFARFAARRRATDAAWFAIWTSAAILTKGTGWALLLLPAFVLLVTRDWGLARERSLWLAGLAIGILCVPWQLYTLHLASLGWYSAPGLRYAAMAAPANLRILLTIPGIPVTACALFGCIYALRRGYKLRPAAYWASFAGLIVCGWIFTTLVPTGLELRHLSFVTPAVFVLAGGGARRLRNLMPSITARFGDRRAAGIAFSAVVVAAAVLSLPVEAKPHYGFQPVSNALYRLLPPHSAALLVSDGIGEGAIISQFAFLQPEPSVFLLRGTKFLASQEWSGSGYRRRMESVDQLARELDAVPVSALVVDPGRPAYRENFVDQVEQLLRERSADWTLVAEFNTTEDQPQKVRIYKRAAGMAPIKALPSWISPPTP